MTDERTDIPSCSECRHSGPDPKFGDAQITCFHPDVAVEKTRERWHLGLPPQTEVEGMLCQMNRSSQAYGKCGPRAGLFQPKNLLSVVEE